MSGVLHFQIFPTALGGGCEGWDNGEVRDGPRSPLCLPCVPWLRRLDLGYGEAVQGPACLGEERKCRVPGKLLSSSGIDLREEVTPQLRKIVC